MNKNCSFIGSEHWQNMGKGKREILPITYSKIANIE